MPSFEWLKNKEGSTTGNKKNPGIHQSFLTYLIKKGMHDICLLLDPRMILEWALHIVNLTTVHRTPKMRVDLHLRPVLEILMDNLP